MMMMLMIKARSGNKSSSPFMPQGKRGKRDGDHDDGTPNQAWYRASLYPLSSIVDGWLIV
jgi:hypothetical protein